MTVQKNMRGDFAGGIGGVVAVSAGALVLYLPTGLADRDLRYILLAIGVGVVGGYLLFLLLRRLGFSDTNTPGLFSAIGVASALQGTLVGRGYVADGPKLGLTLVGLAFAGWAAGNMLHRLIAGRATK